MYVTQGQVLLLTITVTLGRLPNLYKPQCLPLKKMGIITVVTAHKITRENTL